MHYLPTKDQLKGRDIVLIDYANSGESLVNVFMYIQQAYDQMGITPKYVLAPLVDWRYRGESTIGFIKANVLKDEGFVHIIKPNLDLLSAIHHDKYDYNSEFGEYVDHRSENKKRAANISYAKLKTELAYFISKDGDPEFKKFLSDHLIILPSLKLCGKIYSE